MIRLLVSVAMIAHVASAVAAPPRADSPPAKPMRQYQTRYYVIYSDLDRDDVREAAARMTAMAEEYHERTKGFTGVIRERLPFYLYSRKEDYRANGGLPDTGGMYVGDKLMAYAGSETTGWTWHIIQHEGFHQFVDAVIGGEMPLWANEGLAEYFALALFTGDGFVSGVAPPGKLRSVQEMIRDRKFKPFEAMMQIDRDQWTRQITSENYNQAWSMVHFLAHADGGRFQKPFEGFLKAVGRNRYWKEAWRERFGTDVEAFQRKWAEWWLGLPANPTADLYAKAAVATATSFFARAVSQKQTFQTADEFFAAAGAGRLKAHPADWLPPSLLADSLPSARRLGEWTIVRSPGQLPHLRCQAEDGSVFLGQFTIRDSRVDKVAVRYQPPASQPEQR